MSITVPAVLKRGARVRFEGIPHPHVPFGCEGIVTGQNGDQWYVDFTVNGKDVRVALWRSEMEVLG